MRVLMCELMMFVPNKQSQMMSIIVLPLYQKYAALLLNELQKRILINIVKHDDRFRGFGDMNTKH